MKTIISSLRCDTAIAEIERQLWKILAQHCELEQNQWTEACQKIATKQKSTEPICT